MIFLLSLPSFTDSGIAFILYAALVFVVSAGVWQVIKSRQSDSHPTERQRSLIPLGAAAAAFGFVGLYKRWYDAFEAIEHAGDIYHQTEAGALKEGFSYPARILCPCHQLLFQICE